MLIIKNMHLINLHFWTYLAEVHLLMCIFRYILRYLISKRSGNWRFHNFRFKIKVAQNSFQH